MKLCHKTVERCAQEIDCACRGEGIHEGCPNGAPCPRELANMIRQLVIPDNCQKCHGERGGVRGNENVVGGVVLCDYCSMDSKSSRASP